jgi:hypothetical protein
MSAPAIVSTPEGVSEAWLTDVLRHAGALADAKVIGAVPTRVGDGMLGESVCFDLTYDRPPGDAPRSVVGKFPSADPVSRATGAGLGLYLNEVRFYQQIAPTVAIRTPRPYFSDIDEATGDFVLVLEDMGPARGGNQLTGCTLADAEVAMDQAAALHGPRWGDPALGEVAFLNRDNPAALGIAAMFPSIFQAFEARYGAVLEADHMDACRTFSERIGTYYEGGPAGPRTLQHLDFRLDNMLFEPQGGRWPLAVLDWQSVTLGPGVLDVGYFIGAGLPEELRRKHEKDLLRRWLEALKAYGVKDYGWDQAWDAYRHYLLQGVFTAIFASVGTKQTERGDAMFMTMARRHCAQALDLGSLEMLKR